MQNLRNGALLTKTAGLELNSITTAAGYSQMINKRTHIVNESSSCIDLIFSSNTSFVKNCGSELCRSVKNVIII